MCAALGALLYGSDVYGHITLDVLKQVTDVCKTLKTDISPTHPEEIKNHIDDTNKRWDEATEGLSSSDQQHIVAQIDGLGRLKITYDGKQYYEDQNHRGVMYPIINGKKQRDSAFQVRKYNNIWKQYIITFDDQNQIELW